MKHLQAKISARIVAVVMLAGLGAAAVAPVHAQEANPTAPVKSAENSNGQSALGTQPAGPGQVKKEEAEEENLFRHTKLVQAISDAIFHDDKNDTAVEKKELREKHVEQTARTFEWVNFAIIFFGIVIPVGRILPKVFRRRSQTLKHKLEEARKSTADANSRLSAVEAQLAKLDEEIAGIRAKVEDESKQDEVRIKASIEEERARIVASAEQEISAAAAHAQRGLRHFAADLAIENAAKQLILTPETDRALIAEFVSDTTAKGGLR